MLTIHKYFQIFIFSASIGYKPHGFLSLVLEGDCACVRFFFCYGFSKYYDSKFNINYLGIGDCLLMVTIVVKKSYDSGSNEAVPGVNYY